MQSSLRRLACRSSTFFECYISKRKFTMSQLSRCQEQIDSLKSNPYYNKYADKIAALEKNTPNEFIDRIDKISRSKQPVSKDDRNYSELLHPKENLAIIPKQTEKKLSDIMKVELIADKSADDIKQIWYEYHINKDVIAAVIPSKNYQIMMDNAKKHPLFIFPLPRNAGYEFFVLQFAANTLHFTPLLCYQVYKENAPECLNLVHYKDIEHKGIVLMRGDYDKNVLTAHEARCLANQVQLYYCNADSSKLKLLDTFTNKPDEFTHDDLVKELESIELK